MRNAMHFTVWLFMAMQASVAFSQTEKTDSITLKDSTQTVKIEKEDSIPLKTTSRMLKEVVIFGRRPSIKFNLKDNSINAQLQNIRPGNLNFSVLGFLGYLFKLIKVNGHTETKAERTQRILREYDFVAPQLPMKKEEKK